MEKYVNVEKYVKVMSFEFSDDQLKDYELNNIISKMLPDDMSVSDLIDLDIKLKSKLIKMEGSYENGTEIDIFLNLK